MNTAYVTTIVVQESDNLFVIRGLDSNLLLHFPFYPRAIRFLVPGEERFIGVVHVTSDADRSFRHESLLASLLATNVVQYAVAMRDYSIRNQLLVGGVMLSDGP